MSVLSAALRKEGFEHVQTYIQSGNVVLSSGVGADGDGATEVGTRAAAAIVATFGFEVAVVVRSAEEVIDVAASHPGIGGAIDAQLLHVVLLSDTPSPEARADLDAIASRYTPDTWTYSNSARELFVTYPEGSARSKFTLNVIERKLGVVGTARNLNTVRRLVDLAK